MACFETKSLANRNSLRKPTRKSDLKRGECCWHGTTFAPHAIKSVSDGWIVSCGKWPLNLNQQVGDQMQEDGYRHGQSRQAWFPYGPTSVCWIGGKRRRGSCPRWAHKSLRARVQFHPTAGSSARGGIPFSLPEVRHMPKCLPLGSHSSCSAYRERCQCWHPCTRGTLSALLAV